MLCVLCLIVLWGFSLVTSYSGVIDMRLRCTKLPMYTYWPQSECTGAGQGHTPHIRAGVLEGWAEGGSAGAQAYKGGV